MWHGYPGTQVEYLHFVDYNFTYKQIPVKNWNVGKIKSLRDAGLILILKNRLKQIVPQGIQKYFEVSFKLILFVHC